MHAALSCLPALAVLGVLGFAMPHPAGPQGGGNQPFGLHSLRGTHGFTYDGVVRGVGPIAASGPITFDGRGNLSARYATTIDGSTFRGTFTGTYTVDADGQGSVSLQLPRLGLQAHGDFVLVDDGRGTYFSCTDAGFTIAGATRRQ